MMKKNVVFSGFAIKEGEIKYVSNTMNAKTGKETLHDSLHDTEREMHELEKKYLTGLIKYWIVMDEC